MRQRGATPSQERFPDQFGDFDSDEFFTNDFLAEDGDEEIGSGLDPTGDSYLSGSEKLKRQALRWLGRS